MASPFSADDDYMKMKIWYSVGTIATNDGTVLGLYGAARLWNAVYPLKKITFQETATKVFNYVVEALSGKKWRQELDFNSGFANPLIEFDIPDKWYRTQLLPYTVDVTNVFASLTQQYGVTKVTLDFV